MLSISSATSESVNLFNGLTQRGIRFAHWKSNCRLVQSLEGKTDLDLLIHPEVRRDFLSQSLLELGYKKLLSPPWGAYPDVEDWLGFDHETGNFLHLHIHFALVTGIKHVKHLYLPWIDVFFKNLVTDSSTGWPIPRPEMEAIILFIRISAKMPYSLWGRKSKDIPPSTKKELIDLLSKSDIDLFIDLCLELRLTVPENIRSSVFQIITEHDDAEILAISEDFYEQVRPYYRKSLLASFLQSTYYKLYLIFARYAMPYFGPISLRKKIVGGGKTIALIGSDGSGKSTLSKDLVKWLSYKLDCHYLYLGKRPFMISNGKRIWSFTSFFYGGKYRARITRKMLNHYFFIFLIKKKVKLLKSARKLKANGSVVVCDRFPQLVIEGINDGMILQNNRESKTAKLERNLFYQTVPLEADLVFKLNVSPEVASERKPKHDFGMISQKCSIIHQLTFSNSKLIDIDADRPYGEVLLKIKRQIWENL